MNMKMIKPPQPTLLRKTTAKNLGYLQRKGLVAPFNPQMRILPTHRKLNGTAVRYTDHTSLGGT